MAAIQTRVAYLEAMEYLDECFFVLNQSIDELIDLVIEYEEEHYGNRSD
jgi:hypothetical protein